VNSSVVYYILVWYS